MNFCIDCKKEIHKKSVRCKSHAKKGANNSNFKIGKYIKKIFLCLECNRPISHMASKGLCKSCYQKGDRNLFWKGGEKARECFCCDCGNKLGKTAYYNGIKRCQKCNGISQRGISKNKGIMNSRFGKPAPHSKGAYYKNIWMRSSYEIAVAKWCDKNNIKWQYEPKTFNLGNTTYTPDFYLPEFNLWIEIKGWWRDDAKKKFEEFKQRYCGERIKILGKQELIENNILTKSIGE